MKGIVRRMKSLRRPLPTALAFTAACALLCLIGLACEGDFEQEEFVEHFHGPTELAVEPFPLKAEPGPLLFAVNTFGGSLTVMEVRSNTFLREHKDSKFDDDGLFVGPAPRDIAITPDGELLYVTDAGNEPVWTVDPQDPWEHRPLDLKLDGARLSIVAAQIDRDTLESTVPDAWAERAEVWFALPSESSLAVFDHNRGEIVGTVELPSPPVDLQVSRDGNTVFVPCEDATVRVVDAVSRELTGEEIFLGGRLSRVVEGRFADDLYVLNIDPPRLHIVDRDTWTELEDQIFFPAALNDMALSTDGSYGFVTSDDGFVYYFYPRKRRICGSSYEAPRFFDKGPIGNPSLTDIQTRDCITTEEDWTIEFIQADDSWVVEGSASGVQFNRAYTGRAYTSDGGELRFIVRDGGRQPSDGDMFRLSTDVGKRPVPIGTVPRGVVVSAINDEFDFGEDRVFVADPGTNTVTRLITFDIEDRDVIN
jgi:DNA-binding beta-propeller fold protein YncE